MKKLILALAITGATFSAQAFELAEANTTVKTAIGVNAFGGLSGSLSVDSLYVGFDRAEDTIYGFTGKAIANRQASENVFIEARATHTISKHDISVTSSYTDNRGVRKSFRTSLANEHFMNASVSVGAKL